MLCSGGHLGICDGVGVVHVVCWTSGLGMMDGLG